MNTHLKAALSALFSRRNLTVGQMQSAVGAIMDGGCSDAEIAALLTALSLKGESIDELVGAARAMQQRAAPMPVAGKGLLDTCGTGGDGLHTFNISTATALVAAAAGVPVAKHGNRSVSSTSGSSDVLEALGVNIELTPEQVGHCIEEVGIGFCFAPLFHGAMKHAGPVRRQLGFRTIFNLLGPLTNPAGAEYQLLGANRIETAEKLAHAAALLGRKKALVVCGADELDEVALWGETAVFVVSEGRVERETWTPETLGLPPCRAERLRVDSPEESAAVIRDVLDGKPGAARDIVVANSAAALLAAGCEDEIRAAVRRAEAVVTSGKGAKLLKRVVEWSNAAV